MPERDLVAGRIKKLTPILSCMDNLIFRFAYSARKNTHDEITDAIFAGATGRSPLEGYRALEKLPVIMNWLALIADTNDVPIQDSLVGEAYVLGNHFLDREYDFSQIQNNINKRFRKNKEILQKPPHHNLHVNTYGIVSRVAHLDDIDACRVVPARMLDMGEALTHTDWMVRYVDNPFKLNIPPGSLVALHNNVAISTLTQETSETLLKYGWEKQ